MSDRPIQVGDLVVMVRGCKPPLYGSIFKVSTIKHRNCNPCSICFRDHSGLFAYSEQLYARTNNCAPFSFLKRIPPLSELESEKRGEEITA